jgi:hypothetical protein
MFSEEAIISMANGSQKHIDKIKVNDVVLNKLNQPVSVNKIEKYTAHASVGIQLNNGTGVFYCDPSVKVLCHNIALNGNSTSDFYSISDVHTYSGTSSRLKSSSKMFSPESDVSITTYDDPTPPHIKDLYCIHTSDSTQTFYVNKIIASCEE